MNLTTDERLRHGLQRLGGSLHAAPPAIPRCASGPPRRRGAVPAAVCGAIIAVVVAGAVLRGPSGPDDVRTGTLPELVTVPDIVGVGIWRATAELERVGFGGGGGFFDAHYVADNDAPRGHIVSQIPPPGTAVRPDERLVVIVSAGGPALTVDDIVVAAAKLAETLPGFDPTELILARRTSRGVAYKTDAWLFGPCDAVELAAPTFQDPQYGTRCY